MDQVWEKAWPFWKFGLKHNDLDTTLHEKYNTFASPIQDPDAFHHDVYEISSRVNTLTDFERLMQERKALRIKELNGLLEDASFEIVGNPDLIGTEQWALAVQLFRTRSLDSLVRYFASYLPADHPWHDSGAYSPAESSESEAPSPIDYDGPTLFDEPEEDAAPCTNQPSEYFSMVDADALANQPVRTMSMRSEDSGVSVGGRFRRNRKTVSHRRASSRELSITDSEPDHASASLQNSISLVDEAASSNGYPETPSTSISDLSDYDDQDTKANVPVTTVLDDDTTDTPTPQAEAVSSAASPASPFFQTKPSPFRTSSLSANRSHPHHAHPAYTGQQKSFHQTRRRPRRREDSLDREVLNSRHASKLNRRARRVTPDGLRSRARPIMRHITEEV